MSAALVQYIQGEAMGKRIWKNAHAGSRTRVTSMGGLYDTATLHALMSQKHISWSANSLEKIWFESLMPALCKHSVELYCEVTLPGGAILQSCCQTKRKHIWNRKGAGDLAQVRAVRGFSSFRFQDRHEFRIGNNSS